MERKYQLVAWTENATDSENARLFMTPSLKSEAQASLIEDIAEIHKEERRSHGIISIDLARRAVTAFEKMSRFEILTGNSGEGIRYLFCAARYCILEDDCNWAYSDTDLGSYSCFCGELRHEFVRHAKRVCAWRRNSSGRMSFWRLIRSGCWSCTLNIPGRNETWNFI